MSDSQYKVVIPGINGGGAQVFEADSQEELVEKMKVAQENATVKIRELASQNEQLSQAAQRNAQPDTNAQNDTRQQFFNTLYQNPDDAIVGAFERKLGVKLNDFMQDYQQTRTGAQLSIQNAVNARFAQKHPELLQVAPADDLHNSQEINKILTENQWQYNDRNLEAAYAVARQNGKLKLPESNTYPEASLTPAPTTISRPTGANGNMQSEDEFLNKAPLSQVKEYLEKKYPGKG